MSAAADILEALQELQIEYASNTKLCLISQADANERDDLAAVVDAQARLSTQMASLYALRKAMDAARTIAGQENARLIDAAPDLLKALKDMIDAYVFAFELGRNLLIDLGSTVITKEIDPRQQQIVLAARAAIAKATGKEPQP